jgi:hypothetical protein
MRKRLLNGGGPKMGDFMYTDGETTLLGIRYHAGRFSAEDQELVNCSEWLCTQFKEAIQFLNKNRDTNVYITHLLQGGVFHFTDGPSRGWSVQFFGM